MNQSRDGLSIAIRSLALALFLTPCSTHAATPFSVVLGEPLGTGPTLGILPFNPSIENVLDHLLLPVVLEVEESGGFSFPDPQKISIFGDSWTWNRWRLDDLDIGDPFFSGASALHVPYGFLREIALDTNENPLNVRGEGVTLKTAFDPEPLTVGGSATLGQVGGIFPLAYPLMAQFSGIHATRRSPPPPGERRHLDYDFQIHERQTRAFDGFVLKSALEVTRGARRFLEFNSPGDFAGTFPERFTVASLALALRPNDRPLTAYLLAEVSNRDHLFDELDFAPDQTARLHSFTVLGGLSIADTFSAAATLKSFRLEARARDFSQELLTPSGQALSPWYPSGSYLSGNIDVSARKSGFYFISNHKPVFFTPDQQSWTNPLTFAGAPYGRIDWRSSRTTELIGNDRLGWSGAIKSGRFSFTANAYASASYGLNDRLENSLFFLDAGASALLEFAVTPEIVPFLNLARTPIPITPEVTRALDPGYLEGARYAGSSLIDTTGGAHIRLGNDLRRPEIYTLGVGVKMRVSPHWQLDLQTVGKIYKDTPWIDYDGPPENFGRTVQGVFYESAGAKRYVLDNQRSLPAPSLLRWPHLLGAYISLAALDADPFLFNLGFSAFALVGMSPFGNGPTANDLGVVDFSSANPNARLDGLADLDAGRAYLAKAMAGWRFASSCWLFLSARYTDGQSFAFFDTHQDGGQVAITYHGTRGSPWQWQHPFSGPRTDFHLNYDLRVQAAATLGGRRVLVSLWAANLFDFGNELAERSDAARNPSRAALELQVPRSLIFSAELAL